MRQVNLNWAKANPDGQKVTAAFFDMDGTIVRTNLVHSFLFMTLNQPTVPSSIKKTVEGLVKLPAFFVAERVSRTLFNEHLYAGYSGIYQDRLITLAQEHFEEVLKPNIFQGIYRLVDRAREKGLRLVVVSGSLDLFVKPLADHLGFDEVIANRLEMKDGVATGRLVKPVVAGAAKSRLIHDYARALNVDLIASYAYSDSYSDYPMLAMVGKPAAVNPDRALRRAAKELEWPILDFDEVGSNNANE